MTNAFTRKTELNKLVEAYGVVATAELSREDAVAELNELRMVEVWLDAELDFKRKAERWLTAEGRWALAQQKFDDETYAAARRGWNTLKSYVQNLEGVTSFEELPDSQQFRYAAFAAGILGLMPPKEVKSNKQVAREFSEQLARHYDATRRVR